MSAVMRCCAAVVTGSVLGILVAIALGVALTQFADNAMVKTL